MRRGVPVPNVAVPAQCPGTLLPFWGGTKGTEAHGDLPIRLGSAQEGSSPPPRALKGCFGGPQGARLGLCPRVLKVVVLLLLCPGAVGCPCRWGTLGSAVPIPAQSIPLWFIRVLAPSSSALAILAFSYK